MNHPSSHWGRWARTPLVAVAVLALAAPLAAVAPSASPFVVNQKRDFQQINPTAALAPGGGAVVAWENDQNGLRAQVYGAAGVALGGERVLVANRTLPDGVNEGPVVSRREPAVAYLPNGDFLLVWTEERANLRTAPFFEDREVEDRDIWVQRFTANGAARGGAARVNADTAGLQSAPRLAVGGNGEALVVWQSTTGESGPNSGVHARRLDASGKPVGPELDVTANPTAQRPAVAAGARGGFLVAWDAGVSPGEDVFARLVDANGRVAGAEARVHADAAGRQRWPAIAAGDGGEYLVAWQSYLTDRAQVRVWGRFVSAAGQPYGAQLGLSLDEGVAHLAPALAATGAGGYVATWLAWSQRGLGVAGVELDRDGERVGEDFWLTLGVVRKTYRTFLAASGHGAFLQPWEMVQSGRVVIGARRLAE